MSDQTSRPTCGCCAATHHGLYVAMHAVALKRLQALHTCGLCHLLAYSSR